MLTSATWRWQCAYMNHNMHPIKEMQLLGYLGITFQVHMETGAYVFKKYVTFYSMNILFPFYFSRSKDTHPLYKLLCF